MTNGTQSTRAYRIIRELHHPVPYIIQGDTDTPGYWADISRFHNPDDARRYMDEVMARQRAHVETPTPLPLDQ